MLMTVLMSLNKLAYVVTKFNHRRSHGVHWVQVHPQGGDKKFGGGVIYRGKL